jgi:hypothetical protein
MAAIDYGDAPQKDRLARPVPARTGVSTGLPAVAGSGKDLVMRLIRNITVIGLAGSALAAGGLGIGALTAAPAALAGPVPVSNPTAVEYGGSSVVNPTAVEYGGPSVVNPTAVEYGGPSLVNPTAVEYGGSPVVNPTAVEYGAVSGR